MLRNYLNAVKKRALKKEEDVKTANTRLKICLSCPSMKKQNNKCGECGCSIALLTYGEDEDCSLNKWKDDKEL